VLECRWEEDAADGQAEHRLLAAKVREGFIPLPIAAEHFPPLPVGDTPLWAPSRLRAHLGAPGLFLKDDSCNPSGSYKDRASFLVAAAAKAWGKTEVALASTGNAASSMACVGAAAGLDVTVFLPRSAPEAKRIQVVAYGAALREVAGTYDDAFEECMEYVAKKGVLSRNTAHNPLTIEGKKTASYEIARQLGAAFRPAGKNDPDSATPWIAPDHVFVPTGDGVILAGLIKGFEDLLSLGLIDRMPVMWAAQAEGSCAIARMMDSGKFEERPSTTAADSIAVDIPSNGRFVTEKLRKHGGRTVTVPDSAIFAAQKLLASRAGLFAEPSSACAFAGYLEARRDLPKETSTVVMITGSGLKDPASFMRA
jgi:threonine synthase